MITMLIGLALKAGVSKRLAKPLVIGLLVVLAVLALVGGKCAYDNSIIERHEDKKAVKDLKTVIARERTANVEDAKAEARDVVVAEKIGKEISHAVEKHPVQARGAVGPATQSVLDELRRQGGGEPGK